MEESDSPDLASERSRVAFSARMLAVVSGRSGIVDQAPSTASVTSLSWTDNDNEYRQLKRLGDLENTPPSRPPRVVFGRPLGIGPRCVHSDSR